MFKRSLEDDYIEVILPNGTVTKVNKQILANYQAQVAKTRKRIKEEELDKYNSNNPTKLKELVVTTKKQTPSLLEIMNDGLTSSERFQQNLEKENYKLNRFIDYVNSNKQPEDLVVDPYAIHKAKLAAADAQVRRTAFSDDKTLNLMLNAITPTQQVGAIAKGFQGKSLGEGLGNYWESLRQGNTGIVTEEFAKRNPEIAFLTNLVGDVAVPIGTAKTAVGIGKGVKQGVTSLKNATGIDLAKNVFNDPTAFTRGIGRGKEGLRDLINSGVVRGNPRGTEVTAKRFAHLWRKDRDNFRTILQSTNIPNIENRFFSRTLSKKEFDAIKKASEGYTHTDKNFVNGKFITEEISSDPLIKYNTYDDYINSINKDIAEVEKMPARIASGEVKVNSVGRRPIEERFGANSDYVADGNPLAYFYDDGRDPFLQGHDYAGSNYAVKINNPEVYEPFTHERHLHPSLKYSPKLTDANVEVYKRLPFGLTKRLNKNNLINKNLQYSCPINFIDRIKNNIIDLFATKNKNINNININSSANTTKINKKLYSEPIIQEEIPKEYIKNIELDKGAYYIDLHEDSPIISEIKNFYNDEMIPRAKDYNIEFPQFTLEDVTFFDPGTNKFIQDIIGNKKGVYVPHNDLAGVKLSVNDEKIMTPKGSSIEDVISTSIHEGGSHHTDKYIPNEIINKYENILKEIGIEPKDANISSPSNWKELRATLKEAEYIAKKEGIDLKTCSNEVLNNIFKKIRSSYSKAYIRAATKNNKWNSIRKGFTLPIITGGIMMSNNN